ncbi:hypothetical protein CLAFUW4_01080 [Fulvia fulva]|uniref:Uncharacterized protein n=1 Tax=Passalora fulva TaxID=5499 RepID=A0A9Q8L6J5_PASFU|nr:uncharacterized protein CLAFUR5_01085 [Fulvia fulva]KAK4635811.1 hypothetical protein CLAFUR4_01081 [Fulvia fulva]KAK4637912.1 hypothetical protein CLAFUR0_01082 [Fulvia fulva]UJO11748.1 hypothetical protein CLAFUR5_01085 [Fulvia fulva]WPV10401.1 hypothetical protein CLAFUW4_01080 [Fulvia fulva]WPV25129.1 hypothetical protein CLAFUW7_01085 [Fulvia fulva]
MNLVLHSTAWLLGREDERKFLEPCKPFASSYTQWLSYTDLASVQQRSNIGAWFFRLQPSLATLAIAATMQ